MMLYRNMRITKNPTLLFVLVLLLSLVSPAQSPRILSSVNAEIACICGEIPASYAERVRLIHRLPANLTPEQLERCRVFLASPITGQTLADLEFNGLKNELVFALLRQRGSLIELADLLVRLSNSPTTDTTWRDYCVQFLGKCYPHIHDAQSRRAMSAALWEALQNPTAGRAAGSAARQLMMLSRRYPEFPPDRIASVSLEVLKAPACPEETMTALLQVCAKLGKREALPIARSIAERSAPPVLRASAIAALGLLGDASELPLLQRLAQSGDRRISAPAQAALEKIQQDVGRMH